jgi:hypothetical protein
VSARDARGLLDPAGMPISCAPGGAHLASPAVSRQAPRAAGRGSSSDVEVAVVGPEAGFSGVHAAEGLIEAR